MPALKIAILGSTYPRSQEDPGVPWQREIVNRTAAAGHDVTVIAPSWRALSHHQIDGVPVLRWRYAPSHWETLTHDEGAPNKQGSPLFKIFALSYILCGVIAVFWWCWKKKFDVLHVHWPFPHGFMSVLPQKILGTRIVMTCHGAELALARNSGGIRKALAALLATGDALCANSSHTANEIKKLCDRHVHVLPYGATVEAADAGKVYPPSDPPMLLNCGRLIQRKGLHILLQALPSILQKRKVKVVITGEGDCKAEWMELTTKLGLDDVVEWAGFVSSERLAELYHTCTCYVHPAIFDDRGDTEGLGVVLIEALRHRKPVVASGVGGIVDIIKDEKTGLLVPEKDEVALETAILRILDNQALATKLAGQGFNFAQEVFDWNRIVQATVAVYKGD
ncbi:MAG: glycosyltransferase family 4 protein [Akkermansiaceae bacterium]